MTSSVQIHPTKLGGLPIALSIIKTLNIPQKLAQYIPTDPREKIPVSHTLGIMLCNVIMERFPLYKVGEWTTDRALVPAGNAPVLNDDRVGRALHRLFKCDRAALLTSIVLEAIQEYNLDTHRVHNDSTTIKLFGEYSSSHSAAKPKRGHSKDHRPDLKQLLFNLSVLGDEAVPLYFKVWDGNTADEKTHLKNWMAIRGLLGKSDFIYIADCKLCVKETLEFIDQEGGRFITVLPQNRREDKKFKDWIQDHSPAWSMVKKSPGKRAADQPSLWWTFECPYPSQEGFRIIWVKSSDKQQQDEQRRSSLIDETVEELEAVQKKYYRNRKKLTDIVEKIFDRKKSEQYFHWKIVVDTVETFKQAHTGRPTSHSTYTKITKRRYVLRFTHNQDRIRYRSKCDGIFPLMTNLRDPGKDILDIYKFQPRLEKRHQQIKSVYHVAPVFLKNPERIEALLFLYFMGLLITALVERKVRIAMAKQDLSTIPIYPEQRECRYPTADKIFNLFSDLRIQRVTQKNKQLAIIPDKLNDIQKLVLELLGLNQEQYFKMTLF
ncbi:MAG: IS1634 family transposase [Candidatus Marinimicrobia bacterium]|nr:IS1634 family transposase [Candidatus Neomarinimicrobiota bacterium]